MASRFEITKTRQGKYRVTEYSVNAFGMRNGRASQYYDCLSHALFFGLPYGKGSKLRRRPELEKGREVQVWQ